MKPTAKADVDPLDLTFASDADIADEITRARARPHKVSPTHRQWAAALINSRGLKWRAAHSIAASHNTLETAMQANPDLAALAVAARERMLDDAEAKLAEKAIEDGDGECLRYLLKTVGKARGYGDKVQHDVTVSDGGEALAKLKAKLGVGAE